MMTPPEGLTLSEVLRQKKEQDNECDLYFNITSHLLARYRQ